VTLTPGTRLGPYEILAKLGEGGMGEVYRATDTNLKRQVAIKVLPESVVGDAERLARFQREAEVLAALNHPNIAAIYGLERSGGTSALVMELVEGPTLADRIASGASAGHAKMPLDEALPIARQIAEALGAAHEQGIVHRDLKPANVKVRDDGTVKVLDFGLAKALDTDRASAPADASMSPTITSPAMTQAGIILGTAAYMSPEQARGRRVDKRADIWAFGCVLYEMLAGTRPFQGDDLTETLASVVKDQPDLSRVPSTVRRLLAKCLEKDPARRLRDLGDAWDLLDDPARLPAPAAPPAPVRARWPLALGVGVAAAAVAFGAAWTVFSRTSPTPSDVQRFKLDLPASTGDLHSLAMSPDGRYLAMALSVNGTRRLWLRPIGSFEAHPIPASDGAMFPFWSPDSRDVAFFAQGKLKRAAVAGGPPVIVCDASDGRGGSWNQDDVIVFAPNGFPAIQRVPASGGSPVDVTKPGSRFPVFLPDGRHFVYLYTGGESPSDQGIRLASLDGKEDVRLLPDSSSVSVANGHVVFIRGGTLMAQPIDAQTGRLAGDATPIADDVSFGGVRSYGLMTMSSAGVLVYASGQGVRTTTQLTWLDREGRRLGTVGDQGAIQDPSLSPDGRAVAFFRLEASVPGLWLRALDRGVEQRFTTDAPGLDPIWSPRGDQIAFQSRGDLFEKSTDGSGTAQVLVKDGTSKTASDWSRDGRYLVFLWQSPATLIDVWVLPRESSGQKPFPFLQSPANEHHARLSPDGRWIAYASDESGRDEVYVRPFPSGDGRWQMSSDGGTEPRWRGDGKELFFIAADRKMMAAAVSADTTGPSPVFRPGAATPLFDTQTRPVNLFSWAYDVSSDGARFLLAAPVGASAAAPALNVVVNWEAELKR
jgi:serine/threonine protein kinase/Tol biopolymer transport system component